MTHPLAALIAGVKVKPLVWEDDFADHPFGWYETIDCGDCIVLTQSGVTVGSFPTADAAHDAAQVDYEARTLDALEAAPVPDLVEAGKVLEGVTPGPWKANYSKWEPSNFIVQTDHPCRRVLAKFDGDGDGPDAQSLADARFIAWCREGVPALIALASAQAAQIAGLTAKARESAMQELASLGQAQEAYEAQLAAEAKVAELEAQNASLKRDKFAMRDERDKAKIAAANYADFSHTWRRRAEAAEAERDNLSDKLELERALTDGAHRRAKAAEAEAATLRAEVERLRGALERIDQWADAYPLKVFAEPDFAKADEVLKTAGLSLSAISASNMRHVIEGVKAITRAAQEARDD